MAPKKQLITDNGTTSKGKFIVAAGGTNPLNIRSRDVAAQDSASPQGAIGNVCSPSLYGGQLQMFDDMKEMTK